jgi:hypothetical protein
MGLKVTLVRKNSVANPAQVFFLSDPGSRNPDLEYRIPNPELRSNFFNTKYFDSL